MSRRTRRRRPRKPQAQQVITDTPINYARLRQIYTNMTCRRQVVLSIVPLGIEVSGESPAVMEAETNAILMDLTRKLPENWMPEDHVIISNGCLPEGDRLAQAAPAVGSA